MSRIKLPPLFEVIQQVELTLIINKNHSEALKSLIENRDSVKAVNFVQGRGNYKLVDSGQPGVGNIIIRHYYHGGIISRWLFRDLFLGYQRSVNELVITERARSQGVPVPEILGLIISRAYLFFNKMEIIVREIPDTRNLNDIFSNLSGQLASPEIVKNTKQRLIKSLAPALKLMHKSGVYHHDLNLRNILIQSTQAVVSGQDVNIDVFPANDFKAYIIDFDLATTHESLSFRQKMCNLIRLNRSIDKWGWAKSLINNSDRFRLVNEYLVGETVTRFQKLWLMNKCRRELALHRRWWKIIRRA
jgi:tRNA A-37 threonylcarbamoyl transferase component Bud32